MRVLNFFSVHPSKKKKKHKKQETKQNKNQHFKVQFDLKTVDEEPLCRTCPWKLFIYLSFFFYHFHTFAILDYQLNHNILFSRVLWIFIQNGEVTSAEQS